MNEVKFDGPLNTGQPGNQEEAGGGCPFCGAPEAIFSGDPFEYPADYECGTLETEKRGPKRSPDCYERQIERLQEQREAWKDYARLLVEYYVNLSDRPDEKERMLLDRLRALGELPLPTPSTNSIRP